MVTESAEIMETEASLSRLRKTSKVISLVFKVVFVVFCIAWIALTVMFLILSVFPGVLFDIPSIGLAPLLMCVVYGGLLASLIRIAQLIFKDVSLGESPFTKKQVRRIRWIAYLLLIYAAAEMIFSGGYNTLVQADGAMVGYAVTSGPNSPIISINIAMISFAVIFYCLSLVFEYGTLLQQLSDETL